MAPPRAPLAALLLAALIAATTTGAVAWRKGGYIPDEFVGVWKCTQRNHTRTAEGTVAQLGEPIKRTGTIAYSGASLWMVLDHEADKLYTSQDSLIWFEEVQAGRKDLGKHHHSSEYMTKYKIALYESTPKTIPDPTFKFACRLVTISKGHMDILGNFGLEDCEFPTGPKDADFVSHCSQEITPYLMDEEQNGLELASVEA